MPRRSDHRYPIAETFTSVQGEGVYTGALMHFIRLAGCNVGRYVQIGSQDSRYAECETVVGQKFCCDTDYHKSYDVTARELIERAGNVEHICITGGEPFLHDLLPLVEEAAFRMVHIETSGTRPIPSDPPLDAWITCSPKAGFLRENAACVNEWKFLVAEPDDIEKIMHFIATHDVGDEQEIFLQAINDIDKANPKAVDMVLACLERCPDFRLSAQLHKYLSVR